LPFWGYFFNEPTKSSLIGEKLPNLVTLASFSDLLCWRPNAGFCRNCQVSISPTKEPSQKGKAQYRWPPCAN